MMMKSMENIDDTINVNNQNSNMFGLSFTPQMNIETVPTSFYYQPTTPLHNNYACYCEFQGDQQHVGFYSTLPIMSYGSQTQAMGTSLTPKLENFPHYDYECNTKEAMQLNMENIFYNQVSCNIPNINPNNINHVKENMNISLHESPGERWEQQFSNYTGLGNDNLMLDRSMKNQLPNIVEDEVFDVKRWVSRNINATSHAKESKYGFSMSPSSQSSCVTSSQQTSLIDSVSIDNNMKKGLEIVESKKNQNQTFGQRTSQYRGVTRHRWTGRYEAHLWDNSCKKEGQARKGKQVYLGGYDMEEKAARAYDMAALKYWGPSTRINFPLENYQKELEEMNKMTRQEYVAHLRRKSSGFSRGASIYRGVTRHHQHGRWQARIGRVAGNKDLYLGTFSTQEEAGEAYDIAAIKFRGTNAVTNFDITRYDVEKIIASSNLVSSKEAKKNRKMDNEINNSNKHNMFFDEDDINLMHKRCKLMEPFSVDDKEILVDMSNPSSLATSLSSSREGSPENRTSLPMVFGMPSFSLPQIPLSVFASWANA